MLLVRRIGDLPRPVVRRARRLAGGERVSVGLARRVGVRRTHARSGAVVDAPRAGFSLPIELVGVDPRTYAPLVAPEARAAVRALEPGKALLTETSARVRKLGRGGRLVLAGGRSLRVVGVVPDALVRRGEVVVSATEAAQLGARPRWALVPYERQPERLARALLRAGESGLRVRDLGRPPWPRFLQIPDQAQLKERFGEFAVRSAGGEQLVVEPGWVRGNVVDAPVPILGRVSCHRAMIPPLRRALGELERRGLGRLVDPDDYAGCFAAKTIPTTGDVSRHAWGLAIDLNAAANPYGEESNLDERLVETMERNGFAWGGRWPTPDAMHFEYVSDLGARPPPLSGG